jgi:hypothetical protein
MIDYMHICSRKWLARIVENASPNSQFQLELTPISFLMSHYSECCIYSPKIERDRIANKTLVNGQNACN